VVMFGFLFARVPLIVSALWASLLIAAEKLANAWSHGQAAAGVAAALQMAILLLQAGGIGYLLAVLSTGALRRLWRWGGGSRGRRKASLVVASAAVVLLGSYWTLALGLVGGSTRIQVYPVSQRYHVHGLVAYPQSPPVGGPHSPIWQNCGFYSTPIRNENGVHSLEHGAVWITYRPNLPASEVAALRVLAIRETYILVSPYRGLAAPVIASAWGRQLRLNSSADPRLDQFVREFRLGRQSPEPGRTCIGGIGRPQS